MDRTTRRRSSTVTGACLTALGLAFAPAAAPAAALTVEQVIDKHVQAKGGRAAWDAVRTLRLTGKCTAFSETHPCTLLRSRPGRFRLDHHFGSKRVVLAHDGDGGWQDSEWTQQGAMRAQGADAAVLLRESDFATALFDWKERGYEVKLLERADVDGVPALGVELKRADGRTETWYLDPRTYLEIARDSPGSDFGRAVPARTWYEDFRRVGGVMIPHHVESQWYTRERVMDFDRAEINAEFDESLFRLPPPIGMAPLLPLVGTFDVVAETRQQPEAPWTPSARRSTVEALLGQVLLQERFVTGEGAEVLRTLSYDRFRKKYRLTEIDTQSGTLNLEEGDFDDQGRLVLSNLTTGTPTEMYGMKIYERMAVLEITPDGFRTEVEVSIDEGASWWLAAKAVYKRAG